MGVELKPLLDATMKELAECESQRLAAEARIAELEAENAKLDDLLGSYKRGMRQRDDYGEQALRAMKRNTDERDQRIAELETKLFNSDEAAKFIARRYAELEAQLNEVRAFVDRDINWLDPIGASVHLRAILGKGNT
jgi:predicted RNase H-like nuclease (RuvC/YqgF family)